MQKNIIKFLVCVILLWSPSVFSQTQSVWPALKKIEVDKEMKTFVHIDPSLIEKQTLIAPKESFESEDYIDVLSFKLKKGATEIYKLAYSPGPSVDPNFAIYPITQVNYDGADDQNIGAINIYITGNGFIYTDGHTNNMFNQRKKLEVKAGKLVEVVQPFDYVGLKTKIMKPYTLYEKRGNQGAVIATLPANSDIEVLLGYRAVPAEGYNIQDFLVATPFGLVGWITIENNQFDWVEGETGSFNGTGVMGISYRGD